jgi:hypothetical protein
MMFSHAITRLKVQSLSNMSQTVYLRHHDLMMEAERAIGTLNTILFFSFLGVG